MCLMWLWVKAEREKRSGFPAAFSINSSGHKDKWRIRLFELQEWVLSCGTFRAAPYVLTCSCGLLRKSVTQIAAPTIRARRSPTQCQYINTPFSAFTIGQEYIIPDIWNARDRFFSRLLSPCLVSFLIEDGFSEWNWPSTDLWTHKATCPSFSRIYL